ncbi:E3 ubiquitin-protein ligase NRDP1 [Blomia tropicalis]|nr:E3 ubiquitin-protein ligase NRDP1 [Blomia tropicalis]
MGYDLNRFKCKIYDEVICCICFGVLESAYEIAECGHLFCEHCIKRWIACPMYSSPTCPIDRNEITIDDIRPAPEFIQNFIGQLVVSCDFDQCIVKVSLKDLNRHRHQCPLNPRKPIACSRGCGVHLPPAEMLAHHCDLDLCEDAIVWNDIFEKAKIAVRRRNFKRYQKRHSLITISCKRFIDIFTKWMADPRLYEPNEMIETEMYKPRPVRT